ncbi:hypothetical protein COLO4_22784 [Corchorus olitorius]|uniref:Uncharacterized protein n=1 Tax=Corchorus olitorius TaxID=93759 RepID=A0A1R3IJW1_9ROSI|nr:hypothetical protein COLO4_22784 [Corchorus olitorius]
MVNPDADINVNEGFETELEFKMENNQQSFWQFSDQLRVQNSNFFCFLEFVNFVPLGFKNVILLNAQSSVNS